MIIPNGTNMMTTQTGLLPLHSSLSQKTQIGSLLKGLNNVSLSLLGQLCNNNCVAVLDKHFLNVYKQGKQILKGSRNWTDGLWDVYVQNNHEKINVMIQKD